MQKKKLNTEGIKNIFGYIMLFLIYLFMQLKFLNYNWFPSDEQDIMLGGKAIARGYELYKDFLSQHMPFSYYLSALFECFGAHSVVEQRIAFYIFYSLMWVGIYITYRKVVSGKALLLYPFLFLFIIGTYQDGTVILSEHLAGIGFVILILEYYLYLKENYISWKSSIRISFSILLTFGTIFIAAFGVMVIVVGVLIAEIKKGLNDKKKITSWLKEMLYKYRCLVLWISIPWVAYIVYLYMTDGLYQFYYSAYKMNRTIYAKYLDGYGDSVLETLFNMPAQFAKELMNLLFPSEGWTIVSLIQLIVLGLALAYIFLTWENGDRGKALVGFILILTLGTRGYFYYHGTQCVAVLCLLASIFYNEILKKDKSAKNFYMKTVNKFTYKIYCAIFSA